MLASINLVKGLAIIINSLWRYNDYRLNGYMRTNKIVILHRLFNFLNKRFTSLNIKKDKDFS